MGGGSVALGHINVEDPLGQGSYVYAGQLLGIVNPPWTYDNGPVAHIHMEAFSDSNCANSVPFSGNARYECVKNLPANYVVGYYVGVKMRRCDDDVATLYDYGSGAARIHVWTSTGSSLNYTGSNGWWSTSSGYSLLNVGNRFVAGDWNLSGTQDIATFYDYGAGTARIHVWTSNGSSLSYGGSNGWWGSSDGYYLTQVIGRFQPGDFNGDGADDLAVFYDYGGGASRIHVWLCSCGSFTYQGDLGWWNTPSGYNLQNIGDRFVAGDFNGDGREDVAAFYDFGSGVAGFHVWISTGASFASPPIWWSGSYNVANIGGRLVSGDFNADGKDDIATMYDYPGDLVRIHVWLSTGTSFGYQGASGWYSRTSGYNINSVGARFISGNFNADGADDIATFYDLGGGLARINVWLSSGATFTYQGDSGWWPSSSYNLWNVIRRFASGALSGQ